MISTMFIILASAIVVYALDARRTIKIMKNDAIRRVKISKLVDELAKGVKEISINNACKRNDERFLVSGIFSYTPSFRLGKGEISHKSRIIVSDKYLIILDWDFENRWDWENIQKIELHSDGFTIYPESGSIFKFKTKSIANEEMAVIALLGMESVCRGTLEKIVAPKEQLTVDVYK